MTRLTRMMVAGLPRQNAQDSDCTHLHSPRQHSHPPSSSPLFPHLYLLRPWTQDLPRNTVAAGSERADPRQWERLDGSSSHELNLRCLPYQPTTQHAGESLSPDNVVFREPGIGCEMCHGPSASHVEAMTNGKFYPKKPLDPPVDFSRITNREFVTICAQCHMQSNVHRGSSHGALNYSSTGTFFLKNAALPFGDFTRAPSYNTQL